MDYQQVIQDSLDTIERDLKGEITVDSLARQAGFSSWHYSRVFQFYTGYSVMSYVRARRLAHAAAELAQDGLILDVAVKWGFDTHAGFTRAFTRVYGLPPAQYRRFGTASVPASISLEKHMDHQLTGGVIMEPKIVVRPAIKLAGHALKTSNQEGKNSKEIPEFWTLYMKEYCQALHSAFEPVSHAEYGACVNMDMQTGAFDYIIGLETEDFDRVPDGLDRAEIPAATYAVFTTPPADAAGFVASIQGTWGYIWSEWFPASGYEYMAGGADFELYDQRCMAETGKVIEIWIPVVKK